MKTRISIIALAALACMASCSKSESSSGKEGNTVPVEFRFTMDSLQQTKVLYGFGEDFMFEFDKYDTIYVKPSYKGEEQEAEQICSTNKFTFKGTWKEWKAGSVFDFYYPTSLGRNGFVSLKNQNDLGVSFIAGTRAPYPLKGHCETVRAYSVNDATLRPLGAVLVVRCFEDRDISINARTDDGLFVVGIDSTGAAILAPPEATAEECTLLKAEKRNYYRQFRIVVPAGIKLSFYDGDTKLKTTRDSGFAPGTWATISFGEDVMQFETLPATDVSSCRSTLQGKIISNQDITQPVYFVMSTDREAVIKKIGLSEIKATLGQDGSFSCVCNVKPNTTYYYSAYYAGRMGKVLSFTTTPFSPEYTFVEPKVIVHFTSAAIGNNLKTDDPDVYATSFSHCLYSKTYSTKEEIIQNGSYGGAYKITGLERGTTYYYVPVFSIKSFSDDFVEVYGDVNSFTTLSSDAEFGEAVDLGLSVNWRSCNIGADSPTDPGETYSWGETSEPLSGDNCKKKYNNEEGGKRVLDLEDDTAHYRLGGKWRMPTYEEFEELKANCTLTYDSKNGIIARSNVPGHTDKSIILGIGTFWSSTLWTELYQQAFYIIFNNDTPPYHAMIDIYSYKHRIRPVCDK